MRQRQNDLASDAGVRDGPTGAAKARARGDGMHRDLVAAIWMAVAFGVALVLAAAVLGVMGTDAKAVTDALRLTARWSFVLFWMAYAIGPVNVLFGPTFAPLARQAREFGLAYAAAQLIHLGLIVWLFRISPQPPVSGWPFAFFTIGMLWTYGLAALSFRPLSNVFDARVSRAIRWAGMHYILLAFAYDFMQSVLAHGAGLRLRSIGYDLAYLPFIALMILAPLLRLAASVRKRHGAIAVLSERLGRRPVSGTPGRV